MAGGSAGRIVLIAKIICIIAGGRSGAYSAVLFV
jgi:hypothetical protein